jgi:hypothetical protein
MNTQTATQATIHHTNPHAIITAATISVATKAINNEALSFVFTIIV